MNLKQETSASYLRNFIFGVEDSLVSTVGLLSGVAAAGASRSSIVLTGIVLVFVEAFSMAVGSFLAESSAEEYEHRTGVSPRRSVMDGIIMFFSYFVSGFIPLAPYLLLNIDRAFGASILLSLGALFALGVIGAKLARRPILRRGVRMCVVGGLAIAVGIVVGKLVNLSF